MINNFNKIVETRGQSPMVPDKRSREGISPACVRTPTGPHDYLPSISLFQAEKKTRNLSAVPGGRLRK